MPNFINNLPHMLIALAVIAAAAVLGAQGVITGGDTIALIAAAAGFSLGAAASSTSVSTVASALPSVSSSSGGQTMTVTPSSHVTPINPPTQAS